MGTMKTFFLACSNGTVSGSKRSVKNLFSSVGATGWVLLLAGGLINAQAQTAGARANGPTGAPALPAPTPYTVVERDAHSAVWEQLTYDRAPDGTIFTNSHRYVELATGMNHLVNGQWVASSERIAVSPDGTLAAATNGQHQVYFPADVYNGTIKLVEADGQLMKSQPIGLAYSDGNKSVLLAVRCNSTGAILPSGNQVIYSNAFCGLDADLLYTYTKAGF